MNLKINDERETKIPQQDVEHCLYNYYVDKLTQEKAEIVRTINGIIELLVNKNKVPEKAEDSYMQIYNKQSMKAKAKIFDVTIIRAGTKMSNRYEEETKDKDMIVETKTIQMQREVDKMKGKALVNHPASTTTAEQQFTPPPIITVEAQLPMTAEIMKGLKEHTTDSMLSIITNPH
ncbi:hypothetical protein JTB14_036934 [Gonioctena quinquepunctata]|nr:hypothetical protein JTB14_036934 [Gonioctena quinquepunctata]